MKKIFILSFLFWTLALTASAQQVDKKTLHQDNAELLLASRAMLNQAQLVLREQKVDSSFANGLNRGLKSILEKSMLRDVELKKMLQDTTEQKVPVRAVLQKTKMRLLNMQSKIEQDFLLCNAAERVLKMTSAFVKNKKAYFAPGKYLIPYDLRSEAEKVYQPIVDSMQAVEASFPKVRFEALVRTTGYSDASPTPKGSMLYRDMVQRMKTEPLEMEEINLYVSYLRSYNVSDLIKEIISAKRALRSIQIDFDRLGKGTALPNTDKKYEPIDEARRVVHVYWHILPKF